MHSKIGHLRLTSTISVSGRSQLCVNSLWRADHRDWSPLLPGRPRSVRPPLADRAGHWVDVELFISGSYSDWDGLPARFAIFWRQSHDLCASLIVRFWGEFEIVRS